jgi:chaperonin GroEL (HSP60 family)
MYAITYKQNTQKKFGEFLFCFFKSLSSLGLYFFQIQVQHPAAKSMIEISRTQDEEVGDGTTSVIILGKRKVKD